VSYLVVFDAHVNPKSPIGYADERYRTPITPPATAVNSGLFVSHPNSFESHDCGGVSMRFVLVSERCSYVLPRISLGEDMKARLHRTVLFAAYQTVLLLGIVTFPLALAAERAGVSLPVGRLVERLGEAHERAGED
jgi:hypothetical protein